MATLLIDEFSILGPDANSHRMQVGRPVSTQSVTFSASTESAAFGASTKLVRVISDAEANLKFGASPQTATTSDMRIMPDVPEYFGVNPGDIVAALEGEFSPSSLFSGGEDGAWYDPSDLSTLWKDVAGTNPVTSDGDVVARMDDKSGNGHHLTQSSALLRPLYKTDGTLHWLLYDSNDDLTAGAVMQFTGDMSIMVPFAAANLTGLKQVAECLITGETEATNVVYALRFNDDDFQAFWEYDAGVNEAVTGPTAVLTTDAKVYGQRRDVSDKEVTFTVDGTDTVVGYTNNPTGGTSSLFHLGVTTFGPAGKIYGAVNIDRDLTESEWTNLKNYMADKAGVTL